MAPCWRMKMEEEEEQLWPRSGVWLGSLPFREHGRSGKPGMGFPLARAGGGAEPGGLPAPCGSESPSLPQRMS